MFAGEFRKQKALFAIADSVAPALAVAAALITHDPNGAMRSHLESADPRILAEGITVAAAIWFGVFRAFDLYGMKNGSRKETIAILKACTVAAGLMLLGVFAAHVDVSRVSVGLFYLFSIPSVLATRMVLRSLIRHFYSSSDIAIPLVIIGFNPLAHFLCDRFEDELTQYEILGFIDVGAVGREYRGYPVLGRPEHLRDLQSIHPCLEAAIAMPNAALEEQAEIVDLCEKARVRWWVVPWIYRAAPTGLAVNTVGLIPLVGRRGSNIEGLNYLVKRAFDIVFATILVVLLMPIMALAGLAILIFDGRPVLYRQERIGAHGRPFEILKLRTMKSRTADLVHREFVQDWIRNGHGASANGNGANGTDRKVFKLCDDPRVTRVGKILRRFSFDELPQLWNVLRGDMSLIGPRPALPYELDLYQDWHRRRLEGMPGITGLWQVSGRNRISFDDMVRLDVKYLEDWSLTSDIRILLHTIPVLLRGEGL